jgi:hypothetical protein
MKDGSRARYFTWQNAQTSLGFMVVTSPAGKVRVTVGFANRRG